MNRLITPLSVGPLDAEVTARVRRSVQRALTGTGPAVDLQSVPGQDAPGQDALEQVVLRQAAPEQSVPDGVAVVVRTSGSSGRPRGVLLGAESLLASAAATHARLGGPGRWVLALPLAHIAGLQVLVRSVAAGLDPVVVPAAGGFDAARLAAAVAGAPRDTPLYTALVPTQLHRVLHAEESDIAPLRDLDAILVGGAATSPTLVAAARAAGLRIVLTYGMTETSGGCVYDGRPLDGVRVRVDDGQVWLAGPVLAHGYLGRPDLDAEAFVVQDGRRWFRTRDNGQLDDGRLLVLGRTDDVLVTGGVKVAPSGVESALAGVAGVAEVCVVGVPDAEWGQAVVAVVVPSPGRTPPTLGALRDGVRTLGAAAAPRHVVLVDALPRHGPDKVDRAEVARLATTRLSCRSGTEDDGDTG